MTTDPEGKSFTITATICQQNDESVGTEHRTRLRITTAEGFDLLDMTIGEALRKRLSKSWVLQEPAIDLKGNVFVVDNSSLSAGQRPFTATFDALIARAVSPDMFDDEPQAAELLCELRTRLIKSLEHVEQAIASLTKPVT